MKQARPARRRRPDGFDLAVMLLGMLFGWLIWHLPNAGESKLEAVRNNAVMDLKLSSPRVPPEKITDWQAVAAQLWRNEGPLHRIEGQLATQGRQWLIRPWLYADIWLPQPIVRVRSNGEFAAQVVFDPSYVAPLVLCLEVEDAETGQVAATYNYFFRLRK